jgi:hypothetical protein
MRRHDDALGLNELTVDASDELERRNIATTKAPAMPSKASACLAPTAVT